MTSLLAPHSFDRHVEAPRWRRSWRPWIPALALVAGAVEFVSLGLAIDESSLDGVDGWGYGIVGIIFAFYAVLPLTVSLVSGLGGALSRSPRAQRIWDFIGATAVGLSGLVAVVMVGTLFDDPYGGSVAFAAGSVLIGLSWVAAAVLTVWRKRAN